MTEQARSQLRQQLRAARHRLSHHQRQQAAEQLVQQIQNSRHFQRSRHIAVYLPNDGEIDLWPLIHYAWQHGKHCYLPIVGHRHTHRLWFVPFSAQTPMYPNRYGIPEPVHHNRARGFPLRRLDLVLMPLVGFDPHGNRLGMGGGYYDRTFAFLHRHSHWRKPRLVGTAYDFQRQAQLDAQPWDVPLDAIVTEAHFYSV
jgi:5-formyltetrahydrofolate cyclo-ligase